MPIGSLDFWSAFFLVFFRWKDRGKYDKIRILQKKVEECTYLEWIRKKANYDILDREANDLIEIKNSGNLCEDFYKYAVEFQKAADEVMNYLTDEASPKGWMGYLDTWFFSITYLYRHSIELLLKALMFKVCLDEDVKELISRVRHDVFMSFTEIDSKIEINSDAWEWLKSFLHDISNIDKESDMFRYPFSNSMKRFFENQQGANIYVIKGNMNIAFEILDDVYNDVDTCHKGYQAYEPKLLMDVGGYHNRSVFGYKYRIGDDYYPYIESYIKTAEYLRTKMSEKAYQDKEYFLPMCYLYRNAVELSLKRILLEDLAIGYATKEKVMKSKKHSVLGLWNSIEPEIIKESGPGDDAETLKDAKSYIEQLHSIDGESTRFRYPIDKKLKLYYKENKRYNINNVAKCFNELCNFLDGVDSMMSAHREWEAEMRAEMMSEMMANMDYDY